jgi:hypothetical protein
MRPPVPMLGRLFGRLLVIGAAPKRGLSRAWLCECSCGNTCIARGADLRSGRHQSCGCLHREVITKHGNFRSLTYNSWLSMKARCSNPKDVNFKRYGGRGIKVCERWMDFRNFLQDMGERPGREYSLGRLDNDGNYEPGNCRWATRRQQTNNTSSNRLVRYHGETHTITEWCEILGMDEELVRSRVKLGWSFVDAVEHPAGYYPVYGGKSHKDMTGQRFGMLEVLSYSHTRNKRAYWHCRCDCGREIVTEGKAMRQGKTKSCGCKRGRPPSASVPL